MGTMSAATKARLKAAGEKRKGRTLKGCSPEKWSNALAKAVDKQAIKSAVLGGFLRQDHTGRVVGRVRDLNCSFVGDEGDAIRWARFRHDTPEHLEALCESLPWRVIRVQSFDGRQVTYRNVIVFQVENLMTLLITLFGAGSARESAKKYLVGYDNRYANERPGVGQTMILRDDAGGVLMSGELVRVESVDDERQQYLVQSVLDPAKMAEIQPTVMNATFQWHTGTDDMFRDREARKASRTRAVDAIFARFGIEI